MKRIKKLNNHIGVKKSHTLAGLRELVREYRNKLNEVIEMLNVLIDNKK